MNKQDYLLLFTTFITNVSLGVYIFIFTHFPFKSIALVVGIFTISLLMFFVYKKLHHQFWLKSYVVVILGFTLSYILISELDFTFSAYINVIVFLAILVFSDKYCNHQYWLVLPIVFFFQPFGVSWVLFKIQQIADEPKGYIEHLKAMWLQLDSIMLFALFLPLIASAITLFILKARKSSLNVS